MNQVRKRGVIRSNDRHCRKRGQNIKEKQFTKLTLGSHQNDLQEDITAVDDLHNHCMTNVQDFEAETATRGEELKAIVTPRKIIAETTRRAAELSYSPSQLSLLQVIPAGLVPVMFIALHSNREEVGRRLRAPE